MKNYFFLRSNVSFFIIFLLLASVNFTVQGQALSIKKEAPATAIPGDLITYFIRYSNISTVLQTDVEITDKLPIDNFTYFSSPRGLYTENNPPSQSTVFWSKTQLETLESLNYGDGQVYFSGYAGVKGSVLNTQYNASNLPPEPVDPAYPYQKYYPDSYYLKATTNTTTAVETAEISNIASIVSKESSLKTSDPAKTLITQNHSFNFNLASQGQLKSATNTEMYYLIALKNTGNVYNKWKLINTVTNGVKGVTSRLTNFAGSTISYTDWMKPGETFFFYLVVTASGGVPSNSSDYINSIKVWSIPFGDSKEQNYSTAICNGGGCTSTANTVFIHKVDSLDPVQSGQVNSYQIVINNNSGTTVAFNPPLTLVETYPDRTTFVTADRAPDLGTNNKWTFTSLPNGITKINVKLRVNDDTPNGPITNKIDLFQGTNLIKSFSETTEVRSNYDLYVSKSVKNISDPSKGDRGSYGESFEYTLTYGNKGNYKAENVLISDNYDEKYMYVVDDSGNIITEGNSLPNGGKVIGGNIEWNINTIGRGVTNTITYRLKIKPEKINGSPADGINFLSGTTSIDNNVDIKATMTNTFEKNVNDNSAFSKVYVATLPDLEVTKTVNKPNVKLNDTITYTITVKNIGDIEFPALDGVANNFTVKDYLPNGVAPVSLPDPNYNSNNNTYTWYNKGSLAKDNSISYTLLCKVVSSEFEGTNLVNKVEVINNTNNIEKLTTNNTATVTSFFYPNYWIGTKGTNWNVADNWVNQHVPAEGKDVIFATASNFIHSANNDLYLDNNRLIGNLTNQTSGANQKALVIPTYKTLVVNGVATLTDANSLVLKSKVDEGNGAIVFNNIAANQFVPATVEFDSKSQKVSTGAYPREWQFIGTPVRGATPVSVFGSNVSGSKYGPAGSVLIRKHNESKDNPSDIGDKWDDVIVNDPLTSFSGYEVVKPAEDKTIYNFKGELNVGNFTTGQLGFTPGVYYRGNYIIANSYVAPIPINKLTTDDFVGLNATIYLYNTGSRDQWFEKSAYNTTLAPTATPVAGMYYSIPIKVAKEANVTQIPSMSGFLVKMIPTDGKLESIPADIQFMFNYDRLEKTLSNIIATQPMLVKGSSEIPQNKTNVDSGKYPLLKVDVIKDNTADRVLLITAPNTTKQFDNGWDGIKFRTQSDAQIYAFAGGDNRFQISSDENLDGTILGFYNGGKETESEYMLNFHYQDMDSVYVVLNIQDLVTGKITEITDGGSYRFTASSTSPEARFRIIGVKIPEKPSDVNNPIGITYNSNRYLTVYNESEKAGEIRIYDVAGKLINSVNMSLGLNVEQLNLTKGLYIVEAITPVHRSTLKVVFQ